MACKSCEERRKMIADARKGGIRAVIKAGPKIIRHIVRNPPVIERKKTND